jgi:hypothetical protein
MIQDVTNLEIQSIVTRCYKRTSHLLRGEAGARSVREIVNVFSLGSTHWVFIPIVRQTYSADVNQRVTGWWQKRRYARARGALLYYREKKKSAIYQELCKEFLVNVFCSEDTSRTVSKRFLQYFRFTHAKQKQNRSRDEIRRSVLIRTGC